jgi:hypothetical protein
MFQTQAAYHAARATSRNERDLDKLRDSCAGSMARRPKVPPIAKPGQALLPEMVAGVLLLKMVLDDVLSEKSGRAPVARRRSLDTSSSARGWRST